MRNYWLMKSEPQTYSIDDLYIAPNQTNAWDGIRNYQARNMLRDQMKIGDLAFFYHSSCILPGIVGIMEIVREGYPDFTAFDPKNVHYDPKSDPNHPRWYMVDVHLVRKLKKIIPLTELKQQSELKNLPLVKRGNRLSVMPMSINEWDHILTLE